jgi:hypothetical protein
LGAISEHLQEQLMKKLASSLCYSLALDESTDTRDVSQLFVWIRFVTADLKVEEELLAFKGMHSRTRGCDILAVLECNVHI